MCMKVLVVYKVDDTINHMTIEGGYVSVQTWRDGRTVIKVSDARGDPPSRAVHFTSVWVVDREVV